MDKYIGVMVYGYLKWYHGLLWLCIGI